MKPAPTYQSAGHLAPYTYRPRSLTAVGHRAAFEKQSRMDSCEAQWLEKGDTEYKVQPRDLIRTLREGFNVQRRPLEVCRLQ